MAHKLIIHMVKKSRNKPAESIYLEATVQSDLMTTDEINKIALMLFELEGAANAKGNPWYHIFLT